MFRPLPTYRMIIDAITAAVFFAATALLLTTSAGGWPGIETPLQIGVAVVLSGVFAVALGLRRWSPPLALAVAWGGAITQMAFGLPPMAANLAIFGVLYAAAAYGSRVLFWVSFGSSFVGAAAMTVYLVVFPLVRGGWRFADGFDANIAVSVTFFVSASLALLLAWTIGALVRTGVRARENREAQQRAEAETAIEAERNRIARDMHDVVAHSLAVVIAQADGARYAASANPDAAAEALGAISTTARSALSDVRVLLTQLRHRQADAPQPTVADLEQLYAQVRAAGVDLRVDIDPAPHGEPPAAAQLAVYRILQEALTNALRHGGRGVGGRPTVEVALAWHPDRVDLSVTNPLGEQASGDGRGHGLVGMRERAQLVGGSFEAGPRGDHYVVTATLPIGGMT
ncbi:MAG: sensor histidine kinase [Microbacterium sp.]|nr:MAG: sensor histidine kinase [Microbacterium sp.]